MKALTVYTAYFSFIMFVLLLLLVNSYFLLSLHIEKRKDNKIKKRKEEIKKSLLNIFENKVINKNDEVQKLKKHFNRKIDIQAFHYAIKECKSANIYKDELAQLLEEIVDIDKILKSGVVRKEYKESYTLYLISEFNLGNKKAGEFALSSLDKKSLHVRNNALNVINKNNDLAIMMRAIEMVNDKDHYFNDKMIIDFLDNYKGNNAELDSKLYLEMDHYNMNLKKNIISHFMNMNNGSQKIRDKMIDFIHQSDEKEIIISSTRYFYKVIDERAKAFIVKNMSSKDWEVRATSARVVSKYTGENIVNKLKQTLTDENYYVRYNSAESFLKVVDSEIAINEAIKNEDRFARDILLYAMNIRGIINIEEYQELERKNKVAISLEGAALI